MSDDDEGCFTHYWSEFCPCRLMRKNIVMMSLTIICFALVTWTIIVTMDGPAGAAVSNVTHVLVDDSKDLQNINFTMTSTVIKRITKCTITRKL